MAQENDQELDLEVGGQKIRTKGYRLIDLIWLPMILAMGYIGLLLQNHVAAAEKDGAVIAVAAKEANKALVDAIKESNSATVAALRDLTTEQRRSTNAIKEVACLSDPSMKNRGDARDFCKRMSRDDR